MNHIELLRPGGLVISPAFSHVAVIPPGATTIHVGGQNAVDGTDLGNAYGEAAAALGDNPEPPLVTAAIVPRLGVPGALVEVSAIAALFR